MGSIKQKEQHSLNTDSKSNYQMDIQDKYNSFAIIAYENVSEECNWNNSDWLSWSHETDTLQELCRDTNDFTWSEDYLGDGEFHTYNFTNKHKYILYGLKENNEWEMLIRLFHHSQLRDRRTILQQIEDIFGTIGEYEEDEEHEILVDRLRESVERNNT